VQVGVPGEDPEEDHSVGSDLEDLGDTGLGVLVADDQVVSDLDLDAGRTGR
jgi:hypothetical protein